MRRMRFVKGLGGYFSTWKDLVSAAGVHESFLVSAAGVHESLFMPSCMLSLSWVAANMALVDSNGLVSWALGHWGFRCQGAFVKALF
ncbi:hypothetical protein U1Q18_024582 [Sarracenia purpurea var. burkii]